MNSRVFEIFGEITKIPRGSGNMGGIADFCVSFAEKNRLKYIRDSFDNIIIFKDATKGNEYKLPVILQGHLDMVCQKTSESNHDFTLSGPHIMCEDDYLTARDTTLGADNGIAVAMIMAILESDSISHPPIEAVFTTDEEIGMVGAVAMDMSPLKAKRMINLDSEDDDTITVSCAGGSDFRIKLPIKREAVSGREISIKLFGLLGGHSGVDIDKNRSNANIIAGGLLGFLKNKLDFSILHIYGGDKANAITNRCQIKLVCQNSEEIVREAEKYLQEIKKNIQPNEPDFGFAVEAGETGEYSAFDYDVNSKCIALLNTLPNGILKMSEEIKGLVETSLNLGVLETDRQDIIFGFALRSNKQSALDELGERLTQIARSFNADFSNSGHYPPWEYRPNSVLENFYVRLFEEHYGFAPKIEAIHAGLECGVFDSKIEKLSAIAVGPQMYDVHTVNERLSISSTEKFFSLLIKVLENMD